MGIDSGYGIGSLKPGVCTSSTRPASPFEGQMIYETDTDVLAIWNGTAWRQLAAATKSGSVLQVSSTTKTDTFTTTSTSNTDVTGLSVTITPTSTTSKVLVMAQVNGANDFGVSNGFMQLVRDSTNINLGDAASSRSRVSGEFSTINAGATSNVNVSFLDSPATISSVTYKVQVRTPAGTLYINRGKNDTDNAYSARGASTITVMEISG